MDFKEFVSGVSAKIQENPGDSRKVMAPPGDSRHLQDTPAASRWLQLPQGDSRRLQEVPGLSWRRLDFPGVSRILLNFCGVSWGIPIEIHISATFWPKTEILRFFKIYFWGFLILFPRNQLCLACHAKREEFKTGPRLKKDTRTTGNGPWQGETFHSVGPPRWSSKSAVTCFNICTLQKLRDQCRKAHLPANLQRI